MNEKTYLRSFRRVNDRYRFYGLSDQDSKSLILFPKTAKLGHIFGTFHSNDKRILEERTLNAPYGEFSIRYFNPHEEHFRDPYPMAKH